MFTNIKKSSCIMGLTGQTVTFGCFAGILKNEIKRLPGTIKMFCHIRATGIGTEWGGGPGGALLLMPGG